MKFSEINYQDLKVLKTGVGIFTLQCLKLSTHNPNILNLSSMMAGYIDPDTDVEVVGTLSLDGPYYVIGVANDKNNTLTFIQSLKDEFANICVSKNKFSDPRWQHDISIYHLYEVTSDVTSLKLISRGLLASANAPDEYELTPNQQHLIRKAIEQRKFY